MTPEDINEGIKKKKKGSGFIFIGFGVLVEYALKSLIKDVQKKNQIK